MKQKRAAKGAKASGVRIISNIKLRPQAAKANLELLKCFLKHQTVTTAQVQQPTYKLPGGAALKRATHASAIGKPQAEQQQSLDAASLMANAIMHALALKKRKAAATTEQSKPRRASVKTKPKRAKKLKRNLGANQMDAAAALSELGGADVIKAKAPKEKMRNNQLMDVGTITQTQAAENSMQLQPGGAAPLTTNFLNIAANIKPKKATKLKHKMANGQPYAAAAKSPEDVVHLTTNIKTKMARKPKPKMANVPPYAKAEPLIPKPRTSQKRKRCNSDVMTIAQLQRQDAAPKMINDVLHALALRELEEAVTTEQAKPRRASANTKPKRTKKLKCHTATDRPDAAAAESELGGAGDLRSKCSNRKENAQKRKRRNNELTDDRTISQSQADENSMQLQPGGAVPLTTNFLNIAANIKPKKATKPKPKMAHDQLYAEAEHSEP